MCKAKQNNGKRNQLLNTFLQEVQKQSFLKIKLPFTVDFFFFLYACRDSEVMGGNALGKQSPNGYLHNVKSTVP